MMKNLKRGQQSLERASYSVGECRTRQPIGDIALFSRYSAPEERLPRKMAPSFAQETTWR